MKTRMTALTIGSAILLGGCVTAMPAQQFYTAFPEATTTRYLTGAEAITAVEDGSCREIADHTYNAPIGMTVHGDVKAGAEGVDSMVVNDGGNAYRIRNFSWLRVADGSGATQLHLEFTTLNCK